MSHHLARFRLPSVCVSLPFHMSSRLSSISSACHSYASRICQSLHPFLFICLFVISTCTLHWYVCQSIQSSFRSFICLSVRPSVYLSACLSDVQLFVFCLSPLCPFCPSVRLSVSLSVCLPLRLLVHSSFTQYHHGYCTYFFCLICRGPSKYFRTFELLAI